MIKLFENLMIFIEEENIKMHIKIIYTKKKIYEKIVIVLY